MHWSLYAYFGCLATSCYLSPYLPTLALSLSLWTPILLLLVPPELYLYRSYLAVSMFFYLFRIVELWYLSRKVLIGSLLSKEEEKNVTLLGIQPPHLKRLLHPFLYFGVQHLRPVDSISKRIQLFQHYLPRYLFSSAICYIAIQHLALKDWTGQCSLLYFKFSSLIFSYFWMLILLYTILFNIDYCMKLICILFLPLYLPIETRVHKHPILSKSLKEFWANRWNVIIQGDILKPMVYQPTKTFLKDFFNNVVAHRISVTTTFIVSGFWHAFPIWIASGTLDHFHFTHKSTGSQLMLGWSMFSFFVLQSIGLAIEEWLQVEKWNELLKRIWTLSFVLLSSPLLIEPLMNLFKIK